MLGVGWTEMVVIGVVALIVIGPKDLPVVMQRLGRMIGMVRRMGSDFQRELSKTTGLDQVTDLRRSLTEPLKQTSAEIAREFNSMTSSGVQPTGALQPEDPNVESVYSTINKAAGLTPPAVSEAIAPVTAPAVMEPAAAPVMAATAATPEEPKPARKRASPKAKAAAAEQAVAEDPAPKKAVRKSAKAVASTADAPRTVAAKPAAVRKSPPRVKLSAEVENPKPAAKPRAKKA
jgi:sec-independent protein translocase protein TatB